MINVILAIVTIAGFMGIITGYSKLIGKREEQRMIEAQKEAYRQAFEESKAELETIPEKAPEKAPDKPQKSVKDIKKLKFDTCMEFEVENLPNLEDGTYGFIDILAGYARYYEEEPEDYEVEIATWLQPAIKKLVGQCNSIEFAVSDIQYLADLLNEKEFGSFAELTIVYSQDVINTFDRNRREALNLINQIYSTDNQKLIKKLKSTLLCLVRDNEKLIDGFDIFRASLRQLLSHVCEDENPAHITDFTGLHRLLKLPVVIDRVINEVEAEENSEAAVPTIQMPQRPKNQRPIDYFTELCLGTTTPETKPEERSTKTIIYGDCGSH